MPLAQISIMKGRSKTAKEALIREVTDAICNSLGARREAVRVIINEVEKSHWGIGGETAENLGR